MALALSTDVIANAQIKLSMQPFFKVLISAFGKWLTVKLQIA
jgi:hypothetical protein